MPSRTLTRVTITNSSSETPEVSRCTAKHMHVPLQQCTAVANTRLHDIVNLYHSRTAMFGADLALTDNSLLPTRGEGFRLAKRLAYQPTTTERF